MSVETARNALAYTAVGTTALTIRLQSIVFKRVSGDDASIIIASEPVWAAFVASLWMGEQMTPMEMGGASLIMAGCLANELGGKRNGSEKGDA